MEHTPRPRSNSLLHSADVCRPLTPMNNKRLLTLLGTGVVLALIFLVYWPVHVAEFIWDDAACLNDAAALRQGDNWTTFIFHGFCEWTNYFRPLVVGFFAAEVRVFDVRPGPMHV